MNSTLTILISLLSSSAVAGLIAFYFERRKLLWDSKREACLEALQITNGLFANRSWSTGRPMTQPRPSMDDVRRCHNQLAVLCRRPEVVQRYLECANLPSSSGQQLTAERIDDLRNAVRRELGTFWRQLPLNPNNSYLSHVWESAEGATD